MYNIIRAQSNDIEKHLEEVKTLISVAYGESFEGTVMPEAFSADKAEEMIEFLNKGNAVVFVAEDSGKYVGLLWSHPLQRLNGRRLHITCVGVLAENRRMGIASSMVTAAKEYAKANDFESLDLFVSVADTAAVELYKKQQFETERLLMKCDVE